MKPDPRPASPLANLTAHLQQQASLQQQNAHSQQRVLHKPEPLHISPHNMAVSVFTVSQMTNFRLFQTERVGTRQFQL